jgi:hypothetical protein
MAVSAIDQFSDERMVAVPWIKRNTFSKSCDDFLRFGYILATLGHPLYIT